MQRIKNETIKLSVEDVEQLITNHIHDVEKLDGHLEFKWLQNVKFDESTIVIEATSNFAVATRMI
jgi:hypothetical protein